MLDIPTVNADASTQSNVISEDLLLVIDDHNLHTLETRYTSNVVGPLRMQMDTLATKHDWTAPYTVWMVFGQCDPDWLNTFMSLIHKTSKVVWIDAAAPNTYGLTLNERDSLKTHLLRERLRILTGGTVQQKGEKFSELLDTTAMDDWHPVISERILKQQPADAKLLIMSIAEGLNLKVLSKNTTDKVAFRFLRNALINAPLASLDQPLKALKSMCDQRPALILATGPSLNKQLPTLRSHQDLFTIMAVDTAWPILQAHGITPDVVVALDPISLPSWPETGLESPTTAVTDLSCSPELVWSNIARRVFTCSDPDIYTLAHRLGVHAEALITGGSVATQAFNLAVTMGANPIVLIGQDLALTDGKDHADGYLFKYDTNQLDKRQKAGYDVPGYHGGTVRTERQLLVYKTWYEKRIRSLPDKTVINCTEGGARIEGTLQIPFKSVCHEIEKTSLRKTIAHVPELPGSREVNRAHMEQLTHNLEQFMDAVKALQNMVSQGLELTKPASVQTKQAKQQSSKLEKLDHLNQKIRQSNASVKLAVQVFGIAEYDAIGQNALRSEEKLSFRQELAHYRAIYQKMDRSAIQTMELLARLKDFYLRIVKEKKYDIQMMRGFFGRESEELGASNDPLWSPGHHAS